MKSFFKNPCNIYFSFWCLYLLQGSLYPNGSLLSQILIFIILLISIKHTYVLLHNNDNPMYLKGLTLLISLFTIYGVALFFTDGLTVHSVGGRIVPSKNYLQHLLTSLLPIYSCYYYAKKGHLNQQMLSVWFFIFFVVAISDYYEMQTQLLKDLSERDSDLEETTNNAGYVMLSLIPCVLIFDKKPILQYIGMGICITLVIASVKRGAIIISALALVMFIWHKLKTTNGYKKILVVLAVSLGLFMLAHYIQDLLLNSEYFNKIIDKTLEGNSSHRDEIFSFFIGNFMYKADWLQMFFGYGADGTFKLNNTFAHNDWLEILTNQGLIGLFIFFFYWFSFAFSTRHLNLSKESKFTLNLIIVMFFVKTFFSMSIGDMSIYTNSMIGFALNNGLKNKTVDNYI